MKELHKAVQKAMREGKDVCTPCPQYGKVDCAECRICPYITAYNDIRTGSRRELWDK